MIEYELTFCYGIIVSSEKIEEIRESLTDYESDEFVDKYSRCINSWAGDDWFIGVMGTLPQTATDSVYYVSNLSIPTDDDEDLINFKRFFDKHNLWKLISWEPELLLINFCF